MTDVGIPGSTALQFMNRKKYEDSDLGIYVTRNYAIAVCEWLMAISGKNYRVYVPTER